MTTKLFFCAAAPLFASSALLASPQEELSTSRAESIDDLLDSITPYGSFRVRVVSSGGDQEVQNGSSRVGAKIRREFSPELALTGRVEWQVNLVDDPTILTAGDSTNGDLVSTEGASAFATRLGWLGFDMGELGEVTIGKQWSVYYDVAGWTDQFNVFGATSLGVFNAGTDGGSTGFGRAEQAIIWRGSIDSLSFGFQYQAKGISEQDFSSMGASLKLQVNDWLEVGAAVNQADLGDVGSVIDLTDDPRAVVVGAKVTAERWTLGFAFADQRQSELGNIAAQPTLLDSEGIEVYSRYAFSDRMGVYGGGNWRDAEDAGFDSNADIEDYYLGLDWSFDDRTFAYVQGRLAEEEGSRDALVFGLRYQF